MAKVQKKPMSESVERMQELIKQISDDQSLKDWCSLSEEVKLTDNRITLALMSGRPELINLCPPEALTAEQARHLYHLIYVLLTTNRQLQQHAEQLAQMTTNLMGHFKGLMKSAYMIETFAQFEQLYDMDDEG